MGSGLPVLQAALTTTVRLVPQQPAVRKVPHFLPRAATLSAQLGEVIAARAQLAVEGGDCDVSQAALTSSSLCSTCQAGGFKMLYICMHLSTKLVCLLVYRPHDKRQQLSCLNSTVFGRRCNYAFTFVASLVLTALCSCCLGVC